MNLVEDWNWRWAKKVLCCTCWRVIVEAVQLCCCGVILCKACVSGTCPIPKCKAPNPEYFRDKAFEKDCVCKTLYCPLCSIWRGDVCDYQAHLDSLHSDDLNYLFQQDSAEEPMQMAESPMATANLLDCYSLDSYNRDDEIVLQTVGGNTRLVPIPAVDVRRASQICGSCGVNVSFEKLYNHRTNCYFLTDYKDVCYPQMNVVFEELGFPLGGNEMVFGRTSIPIHPPHSCALENIIIQNICGYTFQQIRKYQDNIVRQAKELLRMNAPIEYPGYNGRLYWKVSNVSHRSLDAEHPCILSPCFYSSQQGYNMRLKLDFEQPESKLQLMIQGGGNDERLVWPFRGKVDIGLLSFGQGDGVYERSLACLAPRCFSECGGNVAVSVMLPAFGGDYVYGDAVYVNCSVQAEGP